MIIKKHIIILCLILALSCIGCTSNKRDNQETTQSTNVTNSTETTVNPIDDIQEDDTVQNIADKTNLDVELLKESKDIKLTFEYDGMSYPISVDTKLSDFPSIKEPTTEELELMGVQVFEEGPENSDIVDIENDTPEDYTINPKQTFYITACPRFFDFLLIGTINNTDTPVLSSKTTLCYLSYAGNEDSVKICGIAPKMTKEEVIEQLGEPNQYIESDDGKVYLTYYIIQNEHLYTLSISYKDETSVTLSVDNIPFFS